MADPLQKKYTLVQAGNGDYYAVTNDEAEAEPVRELAPYNSALDAAVEEAQRILSNAASLTPLGSGVRVKVPKIFD